jgi:hypothetical protein
MKKSISSHRPRTASLAIALLGAVGLTFSSAVSTYAGDGKMGKSVLEEESLGARVHGLLNLEFSDHYITPRGLNVENQGLVFQPLLLIFWDLYSSKTGFLEDITLTTGVWNSIHTRESGFEKSHWNEIDPIAGLSFKFGKGFLFDVFWSAFQSQTDSYDTSNNLDFKLTYHDSAFGNFSINPYVEFFWEVSDKATVVFDFDKSDEGWYFQLGIDPTYKFQSIPLTVELPTYISLVSNDFYQKFDGSGDGGAGVFSTYLKFSTPMNFIPKGFGAWTLYAGIQYYHLFNDGVLDGNQVLGADAEREENLWQIHGGISIFF